jgi:hypothetical protein
MDSNQRHCFIAQAEPRKRRQAERPVSGIVSLPRPDYNPHFIVVDDLSTPHPRCVCRASGDTQEQVVRRIIVFPVATKQAKGAKRRNFTTDYTDHTDKKNQRGGAKRANRSRPAPYGSQCSTNIQVCLAPLHRMIGP